jgi:hypothetical protein
LRLLTALAVLALKLSFAACRVADNSEPPRCQVAKASRPSAMPEINNSFALEQAMGGMQQQDFGLDGMMQHFGIMQPCGDQFAYTPRQL